MNKAFKNRVLNGITIKGIMFGKFYFFRNLSWIVCIIFRWIVYIKEWGLYVCFVFLKSIFKESITILLMVGGLCKFNYICVYIYGWYSTQYIYFWTFYPLFLLLGYFT